VLAPKVPITSAQVLNPEIPRDFNLQKGVVLDVRIQLGNGRLVDVEMQARRQRAFRERVLLYWARQFGAQLEIGQKYREVLPCVGIYVLDFTDFEGHNFHHVFRVYDLQSGELFSDAFEMHFLELPKVPSEPRSNPLEQWCSFFRVRSEQDLEALAMSSPTMKQASEALWWVSSDPNSRQLAEMRELGEFNHRLQMNAERRLGHEQGLVEGLRHEVRTVARVLKLDWSPARQAYVEGLSAAELEQLIAELVENKCWADDG